MGRPDGPPVKPASSGFPVSHRWSLVIVLGLYWVSVAIMVLTALGKTGQDLVYPLDETYIRMAVAKNFARHGVWGVTEYGFSSSTPSPFWSLVLSGVYLVSGVREWTPFILNLFLGTVFVISLSVVLRRKLSGWPFLAVLALITAAVPLPMLTFLGMGHVLHVLVALVFVTLSAGLFRGWRMGLTAWIGLVISAVLVTAVRYEGFFLVIAVSVLFLLGRRKGEAAGFLALGVLPIAVYGVLSVSKGWLLIPNAVFLEGAKPTFASLHGVVYSLLGYRALQNFYHATDMLSLFVMNLAAVLVLFRRHREDRISRAFPNLVFLVSAVLHLQFANIGHLYRYEAYLIVSGSAAVAGLVPEFLDFIRRVGSGATRGRRTTYVTAGVLIVLGLYPLLKRAELSYVEAPPASEACYLEQIQPAWFLRDRYNVETVVLNDVGAAAFLTDCRILDVYGLASMEPIRFRKKPSGYTQEDVYRWTMKEGARIAILQVLGPEADSRIPPEWPRVCEWRLPRDFGPRRVDFYGLDEKEGRVLEENLREFAPRLPDSIEVHFFRGSVHAGPGAEKKV